MCSPPRSRCWERGSGQRSAFYFVRENLQAATESTLRLTERFEASTPVREAMIPADEVDAVSLQPGDDSQQVKLSAIYAAMTAKKRRRMPILNESGAALYVVHDSSTGACANSKGRQLTALTDQDTIATLCQNDGLKKRIEAIGFVRPDASLGEARSSDAIRRGLQRRVGTTNGNKDDSAVGWRPIRYLPEWSDSTTSVNHRSGKDKVPLPGRSSASDRLGAAMGR